KPPAGNSTATSSPPSASASNTPSPNPNNGGPSSATSAAVSTSRKPPSQSPGWSPTAPPPGNHLRAGPPGRHSLDPIAHLLVRILLAIHTLITHVWRISARAWRQTGLREAGAVTKVPGVGRSSRLRSGGVRDVSRLGRRDHFAAHNDARADRAVLRQA